MASEGVFTFENPVGRAGWDQVYGMTDEPESAQGDWYGHSAGQ